jgi:hypothetical protein
VKQIDERGHTLPKLSAATMVFWPISKVQYQRFDLGEAVAQVYPTVGQTIDNEITGQLRIGEIQIDLTLLR